jgi:small GTP-binding protein
MSTQTVLKLSLCGASAVGKSSLSCRLANKVPNTEYISTIGVDYFARRIPEYGLKIGIWDLAGDLRFEVVTPPYVMSSNILMYVYDLSRLQTVTNLRRLHHSYCNDHRIGKMKIIVVGNKKDKESSHNSCITEGERLAQDLKAPHLVTSATKNKGIDELIAVIINEMGIERLKDTEPTYKDLVRRCDRCSIS